jgi:hypothetical protein
MGTAYLSNEGEYTMFSYADRTITFLTGKNLLRYVRIKEWDNGYLVVDCQNKDNTETEDYIDLVPILKNLYLIPDTFLESIKEVRLADVRGRENENC